MTMNPIRRSMVRATSLVLVLAAVLDLAALPIPAAQPRSPRRTRELPRTIELRAARGKLRRQVGDRQRAAITEAEAKLARHDAAMKQAQQMIWELRQRAAIAEDQLQTYLWWNADPYYRTIQYVYGRRHRSVPTGAVPSALQQALDSLNRLNNLQSQLEQMSQTRNMLSRAMDQQMRDAALRDQLDQMKQIKQSIRNEMTRQHTIQPLVNRVSQQTTNVQQFAAFHASFEQAVTSHVLAHEMWVSHAASPFPTAAFYPGVHPVHLGGYGIHAGGLSGSINTGDMGGAAMGGGHGGGHR
jgi:hypothetical protein